MIYFMQTDGAYILSVGKADRPIFTEITAEEYTAIKSKTEEKPGAPDGYYYRLNTGFVWELHELPPAEEDDPELTAEEALDIIVNGGGADA